MGISLSSLLLLLLTLSTSTTQPGSAELILEEGYTVSTVLDANKVPNIHMYPTLVLPRRGGTHELVVLDSPNSAFYTLSIPLSPDSEVNRLSGNGTAGFADGDLGSVMFDRPRSFAVDVKGNVYVADKTNHAIRKISTSGVTTIAGGHSGKPGKVDGPGQDASFSDDFELSFVPDICAILITDRGNRLIRQMNLKADDCASGSSSRLQMGLASSVLLGVSCLLVGLAIGCALSYHFLNSGESISKLQVSMTWKRSQTHLERQVLIVCSDIKSAVAKSGVYMLMSRLVTVGLYHLSLIFSIGRLDRIWCRQPATLFDSVGRGNHETRSSQVLADQLKKDLISFDEDSSASGKLKATFEQGDDYVRSGTDSHVSSHVSIDGMIHANILDFVQQGRQQCPVNGPLCGSSGLVKRK